MREKRQNVTEKIFSWAIKISPTLVQRFLLFHILALLDLSHAARALFVGILVLRGWQPRLSVCILSFLPLLRWVWNDKGQRRLQEQKIHHVGLACRAKADGVHQAWSLGGKKNHQKCSPPLDSPNKSQPYSAPKSTRLQSKWRHTHNVPNSTTDSEPPSSSVCSVLSAQIFAEIIDLWQRRVFPTKVLHSFV